MPEFIEVRVGDVFLRNDLSNGIRMIVSGTFFTPDIGLPDAGYCAACPLQLNPEGREYVDIASGGTAGFEHIDQKAERWSLERMLDSIRTDWVNQGSEVIQRVRRSILEKTCQGLTEGYHHPPVKLYPGY